MGGLALKSAYTRRYERDEFETLWKEMQGILSETFYRFDIPLFYSKKESFGDIDIIISLEGFKGDMYGYIRDTFKPSEIFKNGNAYSFDYKEIQVDFILVEPEHFDSNYHYLAFNDLGNFIGRITQRLGLKYGQEGLWYNHYFKDQKIGKVMISKDYPKIFEFLGFDYKRWEEGFESLEDIFEYVVQNEHFDAESFQLHNLNKINRDRNAKRKSYMSFLEYIAEHHSEKTYEFEDKKVSVARANRFFPEARMTEHMRELDYLETRKLYINSKFGGGEIVRRYGLKGKAVGQALEGFKRYIGHDYESKIIALDTEAIYNKFEEFYKDNF